MTQTQEEYWNEDAGDFWAKEADALDGILEPFLNPILEGLGGHNPQHIVDIGCGAGSLSLLAKRRYPAATCTGLDLSVPMLGVAQDRAAAAGLDVSFIAGDATKAQLDAPADAMISRYGIMFFEEPVDAFIKLRGLMAAGGRFSAVCWQEMPKNGWLAKPMRAVLPFLKEPPPEPDPHAPGPFAFADKARVVGILEQAGWQDVAMTPWEGKLKLPGETLDEAANFMTTLGPASSLIKAQGLDLEPIVAAVMDILKAESGPDGPYEMEAAAWVLTAKA
ncbi:MAG: class I SAM-dependent methyltransferase [Pseudomonadota bacterium]